jgi:hypothetical protein
VREAGFAGVRVAQETLELMYASETEWWASLWSRGERAVIEGMAPEVRRAFRIAAFERLKALRRTGGFPQRVRVLVATAVLPDGEDATTSSTAGRSDHRTAA